MRVNPSIPWLPTVAVSIAMTDGTPPNRSQNKRISDINNDVQNLQTNILKKDRVLIEMVAVIKASTESNLKESLLGIVDSHTTGNHNNKGNGQDHSNLDIGNI